MSWRRAVATTMSTVVAIHESAVYFDRGRNALFAVTEDVFDLAERSSQSSANSWARMCGSGRLAEFSSDSSRSQNRVEAALVARRDQTRMLPSLEGWRGMQSRGLSTGTGVLVVIGLHLLGCSKKPSTDSPPAPVVEGKVWEPAKTSDASTSSRGDAPPSDVDGFNGFSAISTAANDDTVLKWLARATRPVSKECLDDPDSNHAVVLQATVDSSRADQQTVVVSLPFGVVAVVDGPTHGVVARTEEPIAVCMGSRTELVGAWAGQIIDDPESEIVVVSTEGGRHTNATTLSLFKRREKKMVRVFSHDLATSVGDSETSSPVELQRDGRLRAISEDGTQEQFAWDPVTFKFRATTEGVSAGANVAQPAATSSAPKPLALGKDLDAVILARCDPTTIKMERETLDAKSAELSGMPEGDIAHFECSIKGDIGAAKWDMSLASDAAGGIYSLSVFGDAIKPGTKWSKNHFARLGKDFVLPIATAEGDRKLTQLVEDFSNKEPEAGTRWTVDKAVINLNQVMSGALQGKWVMTVTPAETPM